MNKQHRPISNLAGYLLDVSRLAQGKPINLHGYMKFQALRGLRKRTRSRCLIETGTYLGVTAARCASVFERVLTIEISEELAKKATAYLKSYRNVEVIQGDGVQVLPQLCSRSDIREVVVFLDGHFSGGDTASGNVAEPALLELEILSRFRDKINGVVVDDFRLFGVETGFPTKSELVTTTESLFPSPIFEMKIHADQLFIERCNSAFAG